MVIVLTTFEGCVLGVYTRPNRALAAAEQYKRESGREAIRSEVELNDDVTQDTSGAEEYEAGP